MEKSKIEDVFSNNGALLDNGAIIKFIGNAEFELLPNESDLKYEKHYFTDDCYLKYGGIYRIKTKSRDTFLAEERRLCDSDGLKYRLNSIIEGADNFIIGGIKVNKSRDGCVFKIEPKNEIEWKEVR